MTIKHVPAGIDGAPLEADLEGEWVIIHTEDIGELDSLVWACIDGRVTGMTNLQALKESGLDAVEVQYVRTPVHKVNSNERNERLSREGDKANASADAFAERVASERVTKGVTTTGSLPKPIINYELGRAIQAEIPEEITPGPGPYYHEAKADKGKPRPGLIFTGFPRALAALGELAAYGADKYSAHSWCTVPDGVERYQEAHFRHTLAYLSGVKIDSESGLAHKVHAVWNALAVLELELRKEEADNA